MLNTNKLLDNIKTNNNLDKFSQLIKILLLSIIVVIHSL